MSATVHLPTYPIANLGYLFQLLHTVELVGLLETSSSILTISALVTYYSTGHASSCIGHTPPNSLFFLPFPTIPFPSPYPLLFPSLSLSSPLPFPSPYPLLFPSSLLILSSSLPLSLSSPLPFLSPYPLLFPYPLLILSSSLPLYKTFVVTSEQ